MGLPHLTEALFHEGTAQPHGTELLNGVAADNL
jgi:hypothetical protein